MRGTAHRASAARLRGAVRAVVVVLLLGPVLAACGIPNMAEPVAMSPVATPSRASGPGTDVAGTGGSTRLFFMLGDDHLHGVERPPLAGSVREQVTQVLAELTNGPAGDELGGGLASAIPPGLTLRLVDLNGTQAVVDLQGTDPGPGGNQAHLVAGQVVLSLTSLPGVDSVVLTRNGQPHGSALPDGELTTKPLTRNDYTVLITG